MAFKNFIGYILLLCLLFGVFVLAVCNVGFVNALIGFGGCVALIVVLSTIIVLILD